MTTLTEPLTDDYPARVRIVVDEDDGDKQLGMIWGFRCRHYSSASTAALAYEAEALQPLDSASGTVLSGASGGTAVRHGTLTTNWLPVLGTNIGGTQYMTHTGSYRVWARVYGTINPRPELRFVWDVGDLTSPVENAPWQMPTMPNGTGNFWEADLGEIRLDQVPSGSTHRWQGQVQARSTDVTGCFVDRIQFQPLDEGGGRLTAGYSYEPGLTAFSGRSDFYTEGGTITGDTAAVGGVWVGAGDLDDFTVSGGLMVRSATADATSVGRSITLNLNMTDTVVQVDHKENNNTAGGGRGVIARYVDSNNAFRVYLTNNAFGATLLVVERYLAGVAATLAGPALPGAPSDLDWSTLRVAVLSTGRWIVWVGERGRGLTEVATGLDLNLATGGALATGDPGIYDYNPIATAQMRSYSHFAAWVPTSDAVMFPNQSLELRSEGAFREDVGGTAYGPVPTVVGDLPRLPVAGLEGRTVQTFIKGSRGDFGELPDSGIDDISARVFYRPCWLFVPGS